MSSDLEEQKADPLELELQALEGEHPVTREDLDIDVPDVNLRLTRKISVGRHMLTGARTVRFQANRAWRGV